MVYGGEARVDSVVFLMRVQWRKWRANLQSYDVKYIRAAFRDQSPQQSKSKILTAQFEFYLEHVPRVQPDSILLASQFYPETKHVQLKYIISYRLQF